MIRSKTFWLKKTSKKVCKKRKRKFEVERGENWPQNFFTKSLNLYEVWHWRPKSCSCQIVNCMQILHWFRVDMLIGDMYFHIHHHVIMWYPKSSLLLQMLEFAYCTHRHRYTGIKTGIDASWCLKIFQL